MSRKKAHETLSMEEYAAAMAGIYTTSVNETTIDEAPMAYKRLEDILDVIRDSVDVIDVGEEEGIIQNGGRDPAVFAHNTRAFPKPENLPDGLLIPKENADRETTPKLDFLPQMICRQHPEPPRG